MIDRATQSDPRDCLVGCRSLDGDLIVCFHGEEFTYERAVAIAKSLRETSDTYRAVGVYRLVRGEGS